MKLVLLILFYAVAAGLTVRRFTPTVWAITGVWITLVVTYSYYFP